MITQDYLKTLLAYNPDSGLFIHKVSRGGVHIGSEAGTLTKFGYVAIGIDGKRYKAHILAYIYMEGILPKGRDIDHINGIRNDNRWPNLRVATRQENLRNMDLKSTNKSGFKGVSWHKKASKWIATITVDYKQIYLGLFFTIEEAIIAREQAEIKYFGNFRKETPVTARYEDATGYSKQILKRG